MIRVASIPSSHPYVTHLDAPARSTDSVAVHRLPDPTPPTATSNGQWWPPRFLEPEWLLEHIDTFDVFHVHFGFDEYTPEDLQRVADILRTHGKPFVYTAHDLHNPHFVDNTRHCMKLDVIMGAADEIITLTDSAAREILGRWGRTATVVPHPHVAPLDMVDTSATNRGEGRFVIGLHAKNLRANVDPLPLLDTVVATADSLDGARVLIDLDDSVVDPTSHWYAPSEAQKIMAYSRFSHVDVRVHPRLDDAALWNYLRDLDVAVLPYRFGTHSGWLEACYDVDCAVIAPDCGHFADQHPCETYEFGVGRFSPDTLRDAIERTHEAHQRSRADMKIDRAAQRRGIADVHESLYQRALDAMKHATSAVRL